MGWSTETLPNLGRGVSWKDNYVHDERIREFDKLAGEKFAELLSNLAEEFFTEDEQRGISSILW
jgi:hypothetical protein